MATIRRIEHVSELDGLLNGENRQPVWIFKHSLTCPISAAAWMEFQSFAGGQPEDGAVYVLIEVQRARQVSNEVASRTGVRHQSPQAILLRGGAVAWHASHWSIDTASLQRA